MTTPDEVATLLERNGYHVKTRSRLANDSGWQIRLATSQVVNVYDNGNVYAQGKDCEAIRAVLGQSIGSSKATKAEAKRMVFVVYGHDADARNELEAMLRRWGLEPLLLDQLPSEGQTVIEKLEKYRAEAHFAVVLATPDDEGHRIGRPDEKAFRARQNVVLELGMLLDLLGRAKVAILLKNVQNMERPSDIQGLVYIPFTDSVREVSVPLAKEMEKQGFAIPVSKL